jgi:hypothetical protein
VKQADIKVGHTYLAKVSGHLTRVIINATGDHRGWHAQNLTTGRAVFIKSAARLRKEVTPDPPLPYRCEPCAGSGRVNRQMCGACNGTGMRGDQ